MGARFATRRHTLIAAPTGSGKTLAAFLTALDELLVRGPAHAAARRGARRLRVTAQGAERGHSQEPGGAAPRHSARRRGRWDCWRPSITVAVRTGDTTTAERAAMLRTPPHILVTTPESLYLLLTGRRSREMLRTARTVIVDEIHAVIGTRRGAHLALTLERLQQVASHAAATTRPLGDAETDRRGRALPGRAGRPGGPSRRPTSPEPHRRRRPSPRDGSRTRGAPLGARRRDVARGVEPSTTTASPSSSSSTRPRSSS